MEKESFTKRGIISLENVEKLLLDEKYLTEESIDIIIRYLYKRLDEQVYFCDYLKRTCFTKMNIGADKSFADVQQEEFQQFIKNGFSERNVPGSFGEKNTVKISALVKNWLVQKSVNRRVVLLLGFALELTVEEVNELLIKGLKEHELNYKDPFEVICYYCYKNKLPFADYERIYKVYNEMVPSENGLEQREGYSKRVKDDVEQIKNEMDLLKQLRMLKHNREYSEISYTTKCHFDRLYLESCKIVAAFKNEMAEMDNEIVSNGKQKLRIYSAEEITPEDIESVICSAIPKDKNGNRLAASLSKFNTQFEGRKFSRQHISEVVKGKTESDRFDLLTMNFFIFAQKKYEESLEGQKKRYKEYIFDTNNMLMECGLNFINMANTYECFLLLCLLTIDPMCTYSDVLDEAYCQE